MITPEFSSAPMAAPPKICAVVGTSNKISVPELNMGQLKDILNAKFECGAKGYNKVQGLPFKISELVDAFNKELA